MHHTTAIDIWEGANRTSELWEELLAIRVSPDPCTGANILPKAKLEPLSLAGNSTAGWSEQNEDLKPTLLEKAGFESLRLIKQALDILSAPPKDDPAAVTNAEQQPNTLTASYGEMEAVEGKDLIRAGSTPGLTFIKVSREPEPQPGSAIDTRRMAYGLKIPSKPLHKRPVYQRIFFSLRHMIARGKDETSPILYG